MADPKYADLPGIAYDQQDVYETCDLPEAEQANLDVQEENDGIERVNLNAFDAYNKFQSKVLDSSNADFSDRIGYRPRHGYDAFCGEYEMAGWGTKEVETPQQKYQRLKHEMGELLDEIGKVKEKSKGTDANEQQSAADLAQKAETLHSQLQKLKLEQILGTEIMNELGDPQGLLKRKLLAELDSFKQGKTSAPVKQGKKEVAAVQSGDNHVTYELRYRPEVAKFSQNAQLAELDQRLKKLESVTGSDIDKVVSFASDTNHCSVMGAISVLNAKMNLLDSAHLDQVDTHLAALSLRLAQLSEKRAIVEDAEKLTKVSELYDLIKKNEELCVELPAIVDRLTVLKDLHEQALQFSTALSQLELVQQQITNDLKKNQDIITGIQKEFAANMDVIKGNVASLDSRMASLKK